MIKKFIVKVSFLFAALFFVYKGKVFFGSNQFQKYFGGLFGEDIKMYPWCPEHAVDFAWLDETVSEKWKKASSADIEARFCRITLTPVKNIDVANIKFKPLLKVSSAEAKTALLEWNPELKVFQAQGMPFYSTSLSREILDK